MFNSLLVAKHSVPNECFGKDGEILYLSHAPEKPKLGEKHVFTGASSQKSNQYGWVKTCHEPFDLEKFSEWTGIQDDSELLKLQEALLKPLMALKDGTPVAVDFMPRGLPPKPTLVVHKVIFQND